MSDPGVAYVCDKCGLPAIPVNDKWMHASLADGVFCGLVFVTQSDAAIVGDLDD